MRDFADLRRDPYAGDSLSRLIPPTSSTNGGPLRHAPLVPIPVATSRRAPREMSGSQSYVLRREEPCIIQPAAGNGAGEGASNSTRKRKHEDASAFMNARILKQERRQEEARLPAVSPPSWNLTPGHIPPGTRQNPFEIDSSPEPEPEPQPLAQLPRSRIQLAMPFDYDRAREPLPSQEPLPSHISGFNAQYLNARVGRNEQPGMETMQLQTGQTGVYPLGANENAVPASREDIDTNSGSLTAQFASHWSGLPPDFQSPNSMPIPPPHHYMSFPNASQREHRPIPGSEIHDQPLPYTPYAQPAEPWNPPNVPEQGAPKEIPVEPELVLSPEQQNVVDLILQGHNVFYTGSAGCGKSTILKAFVKQLEARKKRVRIVAPTNLAALNVNGQTTWNFAGWTPDSLKRPLEVLKNAARPQEDMSPEGETIRSGEVFDKFDQTDVLVIDEISMVENHMFERLNEVMKAALEHKHKGSPFGGVQIVVTGDFCQLSPVKPFQYCIGCGWEFVKDHEWKPTKYDCENPKCNQLEFFEIDKWAFRSNAWKECNFKHINLTEIHRQSDRKFISVLQRIRLDGRILKPHGHLLLNHASETEGAIRLFSKRVDVDRLNKERIAQLLSTPINYKCVDHFKWQEHHLSEKSLEKNTKIGEFGTLLSLKDHRYDIFVQVKMGMRVVLQANLEVKEGLVNGSQGTVVGFEPYEKDKMPSAPENVGKKDKDVQPGPVLRGSHTLYAEEQIKDFAKRNGYQPWPVVEFDNGLKRTIFADCTVNELGNEKPYSLLSRVQVPLVAGYAITVHKSQGMTLDRVVVNLAKAFEPSQIYVALSRARSLKGLKVEGLPRVDLGGANVQVKEFMETYLNKK